MEILQNQWRFVVIFFSGDTLAATQMREGEKDRQTDRQTDREKQRERGRQTDLIICLVYMRISLISTNI
jgi:hypothetical protein